MGRDIFHLRRVAGVAVATLLVLSTPVGAQQQGPVKPQAPVSASQPPPGAPLSAPNDIPPIVPGTPAHSGAPARDGAPLLGLPSWMERMAAGANATYTAPPLLPENLPERIILPAGTRIPIVLETPLSSRFSRKGQPVRFRTTRAVSLSEGLQMPPGVQIRGRVTEVTRPGVFGKSGALRVTVERLVLPGAAAASLRARLRAADIDSGGRLTADARRRMDRPGLVVLSMQGALAGAQFGGKAAGIGAGAGAAVAAVLMMSKKGKDVSVSPGTPFSVRLRRDANLPAPAVYWAQQDYASRHPVETNESGDDGLDDDSRPVLKRRGPLPQRP